MTEHIGDNFMKSIPHWIACATLKIALLVVAVLVFLTSFVHAEGTTRASTLPELIAMFDSSSCKECHEKIYEQWEKSHHARPLMGMDDWIFMASYLKRGPLAIKEGQKATKANFPCFKCHLPQIKHATDAVAVEIAEAILRDDKSTIRKLNISCLVCHNEKAIVHGRPEKNVVYGNKDLPEHPGHVVKKSPLLKDSLMCGQCHGLERLDSVAPEPLDPRDAGILAHPDAVVDASAQMLGEMAVEIPADRVARCFREQMYRCCAGHECIPLQFD
jgi:nitrate reductase cytochrome c-type subunit